MGLGGKGLCVWDGVNDAANTRARWDRTSKQLRVTVITQAKFPSMVYVNVWVCMCVCLCVLHACTSYIKLPGHRRMLLLTLLSLEKCEKEKEVE